MKALELAKGNEELLLKMRRGLHETPELSGEEVHTQSYINFMLKNAAPDLKVQKMAGTGLVADLIVDPKAPMVAFRADTDALAIEEKSGLLFASKNSGVMHACGHDAHTAALFVAAKILYEHQDELKYNIRFIFEPSEEKPPGGSGKMIEEGCLDGVSQIFAIHINSKIPSGVFATRIGPMTARSDRFYLTIKGKGGHPMHLGKELENPVFALARIITKFEEIWEGYETEGNITSPGVITVMPGTVNIVPHEAYLEATIRNTDIKVGEAVEKMILASVDKIGELYSTLTFEYTYFHGYQIVVNDERATEFARKIALHVSQGDPKKVVGIDQEKGGESFWAFASRVPANFMFLGAGGDDPKTSPHGADHHTPLFNPDESVFHLGVAYWLALAKNWQPPQ